MQVMVNARVPIGEQDLEAFCRSYGVVRMSLYGSVLRDDFDSSHSDVDVLVEFAKGSHKGLFKLDEMQRTLSRLFGRDVDLTTPASLSKYLRDDVLARAVVFYDAA